MRSAYCVVRKPQTEYALRTNYGIHNDMRILLIDDDRDFVEATRAVLESAPYDVDMAYSGEAGLKRARAVKPDLIILDIIMPGESGFDVYEKLQAEPGLADVPVILLTSLSSGLSVTPSGAVKPAEYIEKPVRPAELLRKVRELVKNRKYGTPN